MNDSHVPPLRGAPLEPDGYGAVLDRHAAGRRWCGMSPAECQQLVERMILLGKAHRHAPPRFTFKTGAEMEAARELLKQSQEVSAALRELKAATDRLGESPSGEPR